MPEVLFLDTSILCEILDIPGKNADHAVVYLRFTEIASSGRSTLIIPVASVIEVGNHIAQLSDGNVRRDRARRLEFLLASSAEATPPWVVNNVRWDSRHITNIVDGIADPHIPGWVLSAAQRVGMGDLSICHEMLIYAAGTAVPSGQPIGLWTADHALGLLATSLGFSLAA